MNKLSIEDRSKIVRLLVEGTSLRSISRITDIHIDTISRVLVQVGQACLKFHNENVVNVNSNLVQCDEIWSFVMCKDKNVDYCTKKDTQHVGDAWTWVGIDADTKLVVSWLVGDREAECADKFMRDVAGRLSTEYSLPPMGISLT